MITTVDPNLIDPNPYQPPTRINFTPEQLADLQSVKEIGFIYMPIARPHPTEPGRFQMNVGWRRRAAWLLYRPGEPMPLDVQDLTDEQMFDQSAIENGQRADLSTIERAHLLQRAVQEFDKTQGQAGALLGLGQAAVSNLIRMLQLPDKVQALMDQGKLAERHARQLIGLARINPGKAIEIAGKVAASGDPDETLDDALQEHLEKTGGDLQETDIPVDWVPATPMEIEGNPETPPSCARCLNYLRYEYSTYCARPACMQAKAQAWTQLELDRVSAKLGIPLAQPDEKAKILKLNWDTVVLVKDLLNKKVRPDCLRLIADDKASSGAGDYYHRDVLGSGTVLLASTDANVLTREKAAQEKKKKGDAPEPKSAEAKTLTETPAQRAKRKEREEREEKVRQARRDEKSALRRAKADVLWLLTQTAERMAHVMVISGGVLDYCYDRMKSQGYFAHQDWPEYLDFERELKSRIDDLIVQGPKGATFSTDGAREILVRQAILIGQMRREIAAYKPEEEFDVSRDIAIISQVIGETFRLMLPAGWHDIPIHKTTSNCHVCGKFTSQDHVTKVDEAAGWVVDTSLDPKGFVTCSPECRKDHQATRVQKGAVRIASKTAKRGKK